MGSKASTAADGLDRSTTQWAARLVCAHVTEIAAKIAENVSKMAWR